MEEVKRYDAVHLRYEESNIRYGEGCEVEVVAGYDYDAIIDERDELLAALEAISGQLASDGFESGTTYGPMCISAVKAIAKCRGDA